MKKFGLLLVSLVIVSNVFGAAGNGVGGNRTENQPLKKKRFIIFVLAIFLLSNVSFAKYSGGLGTAENPYRITLNQDMILLSIYSEDWNGKYFIVTRDIDFTGVSYELKIDQFNSHFDGNMKCFRNMTLNTSTNEGGIFKKNSYSGVIKNLRVENANVNFSPTGDNARFGIITGENRGIVENCDVSGTIISNSNFMELALSCVVGYNKSTGIIKNCSATADIDVVCGGFGKAAAIASYNLGSVIQCSANGIVECQSSSIATAGGVVALNDGVIDYCKSDTNVKSIASPGLAGGVAGWNNTTGLVTNCYSFNVVTTNDDGGGVVGYNQGDIGNCYSAASIVDEHTTDIGGIVGEHDSGVITACLWDIQASGVSTGVGWNDSGNVPEVYGKNTSEMKTGSTFTVYGWDFVGEVGNGGDDIWRMCVDGVEYPRLWWEYSEGDIACGDGVDLFDFAVVADSWMLTEVDSGWYDNADIDLSGAVDIMDLMVLCENWLSGF